MNARVPSGALDAARERSYSPRVALPETIPVKRTEEEADYVSVRPVVRQTFRIEQLADMLLAVTGKEISRLQQVLRSGTVVYHYFRYWWEGFEASTEDLRGLLAAFPDADASRAFRAGACTAIVLERAASPGTAGKAVAEFERESALRKRWFHSRALWDCLLDEADAGAQGKSPDYGTYSYARHADIYSLELTTEARDRLLLEAARLAPQDLRGGLRQAARGRDALRLLYLCPR